MNWETLAYTRPMAHHGQHMVTDHRHKPARVRWSQHALWRAADRADMSPDECRTWFTSASYLGRWSRQEGFGDEAFVAIGIRDRGKRGLLTIVTFMPRAYWNYDVKRYDRTMRELNP